MTSFDLSAIDTPALVLDEARMRANIRRLAERLAPFDVVPRPHLKTAKSVDVARQLLAGGNGPATARSEEHTSELQSLMRNTYAVFCLKKKLNYHIYYFHLLSTDEADR